MSYARLTELRDAAAAVVAAAAGADATVSTPALFDLDAIPDAREATGRSVYVVRAGWGKPEPLTRGQDLREYRLAVYAVEWFRGAGDPDEGWVDPREAWVGAAVVEPLANYRTPLDGAYLVGVETTAADGDQLARKLFVTETLLTYREPG